MTIQNNVTGIPVATEARAPFYRNISWRAIIAGTVAGLAIHLLLTMLGLGLGIGSLEPLTDENPVAKLGVGAGIAWCVSALIALFVGGWVAGRFAPSDYRLSGTLHGFLVWSLATVAMFLFTTSTAGLAIGGAAKVMGMAAKPVAGAASGVADLAKDAIKQNTDAIGSYVDEALRSTGQNLDSGAVVRAKREIGYALTKLFMSGGDIKSPESRDAVTRALTQAGISPDDANRMLTEWTASFERMKADFDVAKNKAEQKAREAGETASSAVSRGALWASLAFLIGAIVASLGGKAGASAVDDEPRRRAVA